MRKRVSGEDYVLGNDADARLNGEGKGEGKNK